MNLVVTQFFPDILPAPPPRGLQGHLCNPTRLSSISNFNVRLESRQGQVIFSLPKSPDRLWSPNILLFNRYRSYSQGIKRKG